MSCFCRVGAQISGKNATHKFSGLTLESPDVVKRHKTHTPRQLHQIKLNIQGFLHQDNEKTTILVQ